jgi:two-component system LytT family response regulator
MLRSIIIEDEFNARETLRILLENYCDNVEVVDEAHNVKSGLESIRKHQPDLVFLDIEMPDGNGFDLLRQLSDFTFDIIFTTAYSEFAVQAFKHNAIDYLLKPIIHEELIKAVDKTEMGRKMKDMSKKFNQLLNYLNSGSESKRIALGNKGKYLLVHTSEIILAKSENSTTVFYLESGKQVTTSKSLKDYQEALSESGFFRAHRQYIVNVKHIHSFDKSGEHTIVMTNDMEVPVSLRNREKLMEMIRQI